MSTGALYIICRQMGYAQLQAEVHAMLREGFILLGGPFFDPADPGPIMQAMVHQKPTEFQRKTHTEPEDIQKLGVSDAQAEIISDGIDAGKSDAEINAALEAHARDNYLGQLSGNGESPAEQFGIEPLSSSADAALNTAAEAAALGSVNAGESQ